jgi:pimeloyl-ACP methyl ester carboxylesterase
MGGYVALEIMRHAPHRVTGLALLDTAATAEQPAQTQRRTEFIALAECGHLSTLEKPGEVNAALRRWLAA